MWTESGARRDFGTAKKPAPMRPIPASQHNGVPCIRSRLSHAVPARTQTLLTLPSLVLVSRMLNTVKRLPFAMMPPVVAAQVPLSRKGSGADGT